MDGRFLLGYGLVHHGEVGFPLRPPVHLNMSLLSLLEEQVEKCIKCGRKLKDPVSLQRRMGPVCAEDAEREKSGGVGGPWVDCPACTHSYHEDWYCDRPDDWFPECMNCGCPLSYPGDDDAVEEPQMGDYNWKPTHYAWSHGY